jgi:signal transduction histidine kinase/CheY-like chemotaxis protein
MLSAATVAARSDASALKSSDRVYRFIIWTTVIYGAAALASGPFAGQPGPDLPSMTPLFVAGVLVSELSTSFLLFVWTRSVRTWSMLILASAYLYGGLMSACHLLTFPDGVLPGRVMLGHSPQASAWLFHFWFAGYAILALTAIILEIEPRRIRAVDVRRVIGLAIAVALAAVVGLVTVAISAADQLPALLQGIAGTRFNLGLTVFNLAVLSAGIGLVLSVIRRRNVIFLLLCVVLAAMAFQQILWIEGPARFTLGWYGGRLSLLISAYVLFLFFMVQFAKHQTYLGHARELLEASVTRRTLELTKSIEQRDLLLRDVRDKAASIRHDAEIFQSIMATMAEALLLIDAQGRVLYENSAATALLGSSAGLAKPAWPDQYEAFELDGVTQLPLDQWPHMRSLRGECLTEAELLFGPRGSAMRKHLLCSARPIRAAASPQAGAVMVLRDVTEIKEIAHQLHQSQKLDAIGQLTGGVAHDFNNMLTVISGTSEILIDSLAERPDLQAMAKMIDHAANRGAELTRYLLAFARKQPLRPRGVDVNTLVFETAQLLRPTLGEQIDIETLLEDGLPPAHADPSQLSSAVVNLAVNARDAMPNGGKLTLETCNVVLDSSYTLGNPDVRTGQYVMIAISDTGTGIPAHDVDRVFEPFFTTKAVGKGTGLGLSMVYGFAKQSNGHIKIDSQQGRGTTIRLYLPISTEPAEIPEPVATPVMQGAKMILVVEDDPLLRNFVTTQLRGLGYHTLTAVDGHSALGLVDAGAEFDLLFTDVILPGGMNGRELADEVARRHPKVKVLFTSGYTENAMVHHGQLDPDILLLAKPYRKVDLARMIQTALNLEPAAVAPGSLRPPRSAAG